MIHNITRRLFLKHAATTASVLTMPNITFASPQIDLSGGIDPSRELVMAEKPTEEGFRDAVNVWIESDDADLAMRVGIEALAEEWAAHDIWIDIAFADNRVLNFRGSGEVRPAIDNNGQPTIREAGPVRFQCLEPFKRWAVSFKGETSETTAMNLARDFTPTNAGNVSVEFEIEMVMAVPPWISGSLLPESRQIIGGDQGDFMSPRYEQLFVAKGWVKTAEYRKEFNGRGLRIRRQGVRKFKGFWGHCWQSAVFPSGKGFGFNIFPPRSDGQANFNEGFIFDGTRRIPARAVEIPWLRQLQTSGDDVSFVLETVEGERIAVNGETFINTRSINKGQTQLPPDFPIVQQAHATYVWDGEEAVGMVERSSAPSLMKFPE